MTGRISKLYYNGLFLWEYQLIFKIQLTSAVGSPAPPMFVVRSNEVNLSKKKKVSLFMLRYTLLGNKGSTEREFTNNANSRAPFPKVLI